MQPTVGAQHLTARRQSHKIIIWKIIFPQRVGNVSGMIQKHYNYYALYYYHIMYFISINITLDSHKEHTASLTLTVHIYNMANTRKINGCLCTDFCVPAQKYCDIINYTMFYKQPKTNSLHSVKHKQAKFWILCSNRR